MVFGEASGIAGGGRIDSGRGHEHDRDAGTQRRRQAAEGGADVMNHSQTIGGDDQGPRFQTDDQVTGIAVDGQGAQEPSGSFDEREFALLGILANVG